MYLVQLHHLALELQFEVLPEPGVILSRYLPILEWSEKQEEVQPYKVCLTFLGLQ